MSVSLDAFPKIGPKLLAKIGFAPTTLNFSYDHSGRRLPLVEEHVEAAQAPVTQYSISGTDWHPEKSDLRIRFGMRIAAPGFLFGPAGVASAKGSVIGIGIRWTDSRANVRGAFPLGEVHADTSDRPVEITGTHVWTPGVLRGLLVLETVAYLLRRGEPNLKERHFARVSGTVLGILHQSDVVIDGSGSMFPIQHVSLPGEPLWSVVCSWVDPLSDTFSEETFCLQLNTTHPDYPMLLNAESGRMTPLFREVLASALQILIDRVLSDASRDAVLNGTELEDGTIAYLVHYLISVFELPTQTDRPEELAAALRKMIGAKF